MQNMRDKGEPISVSPKANAFSPCFDGLRLKDLLGKGQPAYLTLALVNLAVGCELQSTVNHKGALATEPKVECSGTNE